jgi:hypothetical protein
MSFNNFRKNLTITTAVAAVIGVATCLLPASVEAQIVPRVTTRQRMFGIPNEEARFSLIDFVLDTSVEDINSLNSLGEFPGAIQNLRVDSEVDEVPDLFVESGNLTASRLMFNANNEVEPTVTDFSDRNNIDNITLFDLSPDGTSIDWLRYDVTFPNRTETLTLFLPSNDSSLINSLSGLNDFSNPIQAVVSRPDVDRVESRTAKIVASNPDILRQSITIVSVPEPTATATLFGIGAFGVISLLKRNKCNKSLSQSG